MWQLAVPRWTGGGRRLAQVLKKSVPYYFYCIKSLYKVLLRKFATAHRREGIEQQRLARAVHHGEVDDTELGIAPRPALEGVLSRGFPQSKGCARSGAEVLHQCQKRPNIEVKET
jgi:hypothetical protein